MAFWDRVHYEAHENGKKRQPSIARSIGDVTFWSFRQLFGYRDEKAIYEEGSKNVHVISSQKPSSPFAPLIALLMLALAPLTLLGAIIGSFASIRIKRQKKSLEKKRLAAIADSNVNISAKLLNDRFKGIENNLSVHSIKSTPIVPISKQDAPSMRSLPNFGGLKTHDNDSRPSFSLLTPDNLKSVAGIEKENKIERIHTWAQDQLENYSDDAWKDDAFDTPFEDTQAQAKSSAPSPKTSRSLEEHDLEQPAEQQPVEQQPLEQQPVEQPQRPLDVVIIPGDGTCGYHTLAAHVHYTPALKEQYGAILPYVAGFEQMGNIRAVREGTYRILSNFFNTLGPQQKQNFISVFREGNCSPISDDDFLSLMLMRIVHSNTRSANPDHDLYLGNEIIACLSIAMQMDFRVVSTSIGSCSSSGFCILMREYQRLRTEFPPITEHGAFGALHTGGHFDYIQSADLLPPEDDPSFEMAKHDLLRMRRAKHQRRFHKKPSEKCKVTITDLPASILSTPTHRITKASFDLNNAEDLESCRLLLETLLASPHLIRKEVVIGLAEGIHNRAKKHSSSLGDKVKRSLGRIFESAHKKPARGNRRLPPRPPFK